MPDEKKSPEWRLATKAIHGPERMAKAHHSVITPIVQTSNFSFDTTAELVEFMAEKQKGRTIREVEYARYGNPTQSEVERKLAALEGAEKALLFSSGMSAVVTPLMAFLQRDGHIIFTNDCYRKTREVAQTLLERLGLAYTLVEPDMASIEGAIRPNTNIIFSESPTNPYMRCIDLVKLVEVARRHNCITMIDSTLATPCNQRPIEFGVDLVIHSATKYMGGHNDLMAGSLAGSTAMVEATYKVQNMLGSIPGAFTCFLLERGLKTFAMRMEHHNKNGLEVARFLEGQPKVERVWYHGLESHPDYKIAQEQMTGCGSVISFMVKGDFDITARFIDSLKIFLITPSLGGTESMVTQPTVMSYFEYTKERREALGIFDNLVRISLGCEDVRDLIADLRQALARI